MTPEELNKAIEQLKAEGHSEEEILGAFYKMFQNDELTLDELDGITNAMGYHLTDEFKSMSSEEQKTKGYEEQTVDKEEVEDAKEIEPEEKEDEDNGDGKDEEDEEDEEDEKERAMKLFGN